MYTFILTLHIVSAAAACLYIPATLALALMQHGNIRRNKFVALLSGGSVTASGLALVALVGRPLGIFCIQVSAVLALMTASYIIMRQRSRATKSLTS